MTSELDIVKAWVAGNSIEATAKYLADDFQWSDQSGDTVMDKAAYLGMGTLMYASFDELKYVATNVRQEGDIVYLTGHFEGKHVNDFDLSAMGMGVIPASGKWIVWPDSTDRVVVEGDQIVSMTNVSDDGGMEAFLAPLMG